MSSSTIRAAAVQLHAVPGDTAGNLSRAEVLVSQAAEQGAQLILLPELTPGGYLLTAEVWNSAETWDGKSIHWLRSTAKRLGVYLGMSYLEAEVSDFYNSFVLVKPDGEIAGRVRKNPPASAEAYLFRAGDDPHFIDTEIGRIGVSICYEAILHERLAELSQYGIDIMLIPMSAATPAPTFPIRKKDCLAYEEMLRGLASHHARALGVPVIMANKCGPLVTALPSSIMPLQDTHFPGLSTIANAQGEVLSQLGSAEELAVADIELDPSLKSDNAPRAYGRWALPVPWFSFMFPLVAFFGTRNYTKSRMREERALAITHSVANK